VNMFQNIGMSGSANH